MAIDFKDIPLQKKRTDRYIALALGLIALLCYGLTVSTGVYPGESAILMSTYSGLTPPELPLHPIWGAIVGWLGKLTWGSLPLRLNLFSLLASVVSVVLLFRIVNYMIYELIYEEYSIDYAERISTISAATAAIVYMLCMPAWQAAVRLQNQSFNTMLVLVAASLLVSYARSGRGFYLPLFALLCGLGVVETTLFLPMLPVLLFFLIVVLWKKGTLSLARCAWLALIALVGLSLYYFSARHFLTQDHAQALGYSSAGEVVLNLWKTQIKELASGLPQVNWFILLLMSVIPWLACGFAAPRSLNNERSWSQYILNLILTVIVIIAFTNGAISPWIILLPYGKLPLWAGAMLAMTAGYLVAYWYLLLKVQRPKRDITVSRLVKSTGDWLGLIITYPLIVLLLIASLLNARECRGSRGAFADRCAATILERLGDRTWFVTDGTLDAHLAIMARERGRELHLLCLQMDLNKPYLKKLAHLIEAQQLFPDEALPRLKTSLSLGILPFLQDWLAFDSEISSKMAIFGVPDLWYSADLTPIPDFFFFSATDDIQQINGPALHKEYENFWQEMEPLLYRSRRKHPDATARFRMQLRRHLGFVANNLGVLLEDLKEPELAFKSYTYVHDVIDPSNVSVMFNRFEMARRDVQAAAASKEIIEKELRDFIANLKHQYPLWSLSRYYGYVRSPELFARLGWAWALSGQTGAALKGLRTAAGLLTDERAQSSAMLSEAAIYSLAGDKEKTAAIYHDLLKSDPSNRSALLGLARMAMQEGSMDKARGWLEQAASADDKRGALGVEWATIHLINNNLDQARLVLQESVDLQPKNLQAWAMLALINIQQEQLDDIDTVILPRMEKIAGTVDNYYIQITRAQLAQKKGPKFRRQAREAFIRAAILKPEVQGVKDAILQLDIAMNDQQSAELHARQVLRNNRKHALANYVMGSLRLQEGSYGEAESFLQQSVATSPSAAALNDLAEVQRRIRKFDAAERNARAACDLSPELYVVWETLAATLLEADKDLNEAEKAVNRSLELYDKDIRVRITLARILLKQGEIERAREAIYHVRNHQKELSIYDQEELAKLLKAASAQRQ